MQSGKGFNKMEIGFGIIILTSICSKMESIVFYLCEEANKKKAIVSVARNR